MTLLVSYTRSYVRMSWFGMKFVLGPYAYNLKQNILSSGC